MINASDMSRYIYCPRGLYLSAVLGVVAPQTMEQGRGVVGHAVRRELSMRQAKLLSKIRSVGDFDAVLRAELDAVLADIPFIFAERWSAGYGMFIPDVRAEVLSELDSMGEELSAMVSDMGFDEALQHVTPWRTEHTLKSEALDLCGRIDKVMRTDTYLPVEIKTGKVYGLSWEGDRVQLCAYGMLLEEKYGLKVPYGLIEYTRVQDRRPVLFTEKLRRQVIYVRDSVASLLAGGAPPVCPHGQPKKCDSCSLSVQCYRI